MHRLGMGLTICGLLVATYSTALALKCYTCERCNDPFKKEGIPIDETCETGPCLKGKSLSDTDLYKTNDVIRFCSKEKKEVGCHKEEVEGNVTIHICYCDTDLCNGSDVISMATGILTVAIVILKTVL